MAARRTYADLFPTLGRPDRVRVVGRLVREPSRVLAALDRTRPLTELTQDDVPYADFEVRVAGRRVTGVSDGHGWLDLTFQADELPPGRHVLEVSSPEGEVWGTSHATVLARGSRPLVVTSDLDLTYLSADVTSWRGRFQALWSDAPRRRSVPGLPELYRSVSERHPLIFLSASPRFFKRTLEAVFVRDRLRISALHLKDVKSLVRYGRIAEIAHQVGYKLTCLLRQRRHLPRGAREVLLGDDSEADAAIYAAYRDWLTRALPTEADLDARLVELGLNEERRLAVRQAANAIDTHRAPDAVVLIAIRRTGRQRAGLERWVAEGVRYAGAEQLRRALGDAGVL